ncbi:hypothetical protein [Paenibacillus radicis (ex Gao et al. 2016)]|uniref:Uncharacterized protein n=1 Tax=Paenibacillus radicis (ex Gao et al. 2016) TaxID=1737354 RepID=A0A917HP48_9BACL|nr:hypothetical protein [Paenibacillus radicis (ex Gao et al. 2016)]GGG86228.1 hypothetical protein GCM10010918_50480 [Paenibacillus radicis (ex Gao et al. 2016)]
MSEVKFRISEFLKLLEIIKKISNKNQTIVSSTTSLRTYYAQLVFEKSLLNAISISKLIPSNNDEERYKYLDVSSIASLTRNLIEIHHVFNYFCERNITEEEFNFRMYLASYHSSMTQDRIIDRLGIPPKNGLFSTDFVQSTIKLYLESSTVFSTLSEVQKREILKGKHAFLFERISKSITPITKKQESGVYNLLSNSVHSYPFGLNNYSNVYVRDHLDNVGLAFISIEIGILFLSSIVKEYLFLRKKLASALSNEEKSEILEISKINLLDSWMHEKF